MSVRVLEAKAIGLPSRSRAAPRQYSLVSVCMTTGFVQSKYASVVLSNVLHINCSGFWNAMSVEGFQSQLEICSLKKMVLEAKLGKKGCK